MGIFRTNRVSLKRLFSK